jgi:hypothetical protein
MMPPKTRRRVPHSKRAAHLLAQAERARKQAASCGASLEAELWQLHAELCERQLQVKPPRGKNRSA